MSKTLSCKKCELSLTAEEHGKVLIFVNWDKATVVDKDRSPLAIMEGTSLVFCTNQCLIDWLRSEGLLAWYNITEEVLEVLGK